MIFLYKYLSLLVLTKGEGELEGECFSRVLLAIPGVLQ